LKKYSENIEISTGIVKAQQDFFHHIESMRKL